MHAYSTGVHSLLLGTTRDATRFLHATQMRLQDVIVVTSKCTPIAQSAAHTCTADIDLSATATGISKPCTGGTG